MEFRLGSFGVLAARRVAWQRAAMRRHNRSPAARGSDDAELPCLLHACPPGHADHEWLKAAHAALEDARPVDVRLLACQAASGPDAPLTLVAVALGVRSEVRRGDVVQGGFAVTRTEDRGLELLPRLFRVCCTNGSVTLARVSPSHAIDASGLRAGIAETLSQRFVDAEVSRLVRAADVDVRDPVDVLRRAHVIADIEAIRSEFERQAARSLYDLINAVTAVARGTRDWVRRLEEEGDAGGLLALLERGPDQHPRGLALQPPRAEERLAVHA